MLYTGCFTKEAILLLLSRTTENFKKNWLLHMHFGVIVTYWIREIESGHFTFWKCYIQGGPRTKQFNCLLCGAPKIKKRRNFSTFWWIVSNQNQKANYAFWKCYIQGAPRKKEYHCFFCGATKNLRKIDFYTCTLD